MAKANQPMKGVGLVDGDERHFQALKPAHFDILMIGDQPYADIAASLNIPLGTVRSRLNRARKALQALRDAHAAQQPAEAAE